MCSNSMQKQNSPPKLILRNRYRKWARERNRDRDRETESYKDRGRKGGEIERGTYLARKGGGDKLLPFAGKEGNQERQPARLFIKTSFLVPQDFPSSLSTSANPHQTKPRNIPSNLSLSMPIAEKAKIETKIFHKTLEDLEKRLFQISFPKRKGQKRRRRRTRRRGRSRVVWGWGLRGSRKRNLANTENATGSIYAAEEGFRRDRCTHGVGRCHAFSLL